MKQLSSILLSVMARHSQTIVIDCDLSHSSGTSEVARRFESRFINVGVAEQNAMGIAAGLALAGMTPIVHTFASFGTMRALEQIRTGIAYQNLRVVLCFTKGGLAASYSGPTHHSIEDFAIMRAIPTMRVIAPNDFAELEILLEQALHQTGPTYFRVPPESVQADTEACSIKIGKGVLLQDGTDLTLAFTGSVLPAVRAAINSLNDASTSIRILYFHTIKPIDTNLIRAAAAETGGIVVVEEHSKVGGLGSAISDCLSDATNPFMVPVARVGIDDMFCYDSGSHSEMVDRYCVSSRRIRQAIHTVSNATL